MRDTYDEIELRDALAAAGYLRCDERGDLVIYSYTDRCGFERAWNDITLNSRGHIFDRRTRECVARPFPKFFSLEDYDEAALPWGRPWLAFEKVDGFLGVHYRRPESTHAVATRGSFRTPAAAWATERLQGHGLQGLPEAVTLCFEIVHPMTRVVVDYAGRQDLVLLAAFNRHTGREFAWPQVQLWAEEFGFSLPRVHPACREQIAELLAGADGRDFEGFVIRFSDGTRVKAKAADYLARLREHPLPSAPVGVH